MKKLTKEEFQQLVNTIITLPDGWLGKTSGDVGALNDFYCNLSKVKRIIENE